MDPHAGLPARTPRERMLLDLLGLLWSRYRGRMEHVRRYEAVLAAHRARFRNDHIAFRTLAAQRPAVGLFTTGRIFEALGYVPAGCYEFPDKKLSAVHFAHPDPELPKVFISELKTWELPGLGRRVVARSLRTHRPALPDECLSALAKPERLACAPRRRLLAAVDGFFRELPWDPPQKRDVLALDAESQFGAWVLLNGYEVNHFTASVDAHGVAALGDIEKTAAALRAAGVPMKPRIEGERGTRLRQSSTEAVVLPARVRDGRGAARLPWTYAYFELAERPPFRDPATGRRARFDGFLGPQATNLFEMTSRARPRAGRRGP